MSTPVATVGLLFDGTDLQAEDLTIFFEIETGLDEMPSVRGDDVTLAALAGRSERNRVNDILPVVLRGHVRADPTIDDRDVAHADFRAKMRFLRLLFASNRGRGSLVALLEDESTATISARPMNLRKTAQIGSEYWSGSIELEAYDDWIIADAS